MSEQVSVLLTEPSSLGGFELEGQVLIPVVTAIETLAPSKKRPNYRVKMEVAFSPDGCPEEADVTWLAPGPRSQLRRAIVLLVFEPNTLVLPEEENHVAV